MTILWYENRSGPKPLVLWCSRQKRNGAFNVQATFIESEGFDMF